MIKKIKLKKKRTGRPYICLFFYARTLYSMVINMTDEQLVLHYQRLIKTRKKMLAAPLSPYEWVNDNANNMFGFLIRRIEVAHNEMLFRCITPGCSVVELSWHYYCPVHTVWKKEKFKKEECKAVSLNNTHLMAQRRKQRRQWIAFSLISASGSFQPTRVMRPLAMKNKIKAELLRAA